VLCRFASPVANGSSKKALRGRTVGIIMSVDCICGAPFGSGRLH
jgi:hypothetical protein